MNYTQTASFSFTPEGGESQNRTATLVVSLVNEDTISYTITYDSDLPISGSSGSPYGNNPYGVFCTINELRGKGIAPNIYPSPDNDEDTYKLRVNVVGRETFDTDNLKGRQGSRGATGVRGEAGKNAALEAIEVSTSNFSGGKIIIRNAVEGVTGLVHHIGATSNIVAYRQIWDATTETWKTAIISADNVEVSSDGTVTITDTPFTGKILLSSGSGYSAAGGGGGGHRVLVKDEDYVFDDGTSEDGIGLATITFTENLECPLYSAFFRGRAISGSTETTMAMNLMLKNVPFEMEEEYEDEDGNTQSLAVGTCDEKLFASTLSGSTILAYASAYYININGVEQWGISLGGLSGGMTFVADEIEIIQV
jgi:hypothetical protein